MMEACDRLGQKLDEVAGLFREQVEAWRQIRPPAAPRENAVHRAVTAPGRERAPAAEETPPTAAFPIAAPPDNPAVQAGPSSEQQREVAGNLPPASAPQAAPGPQPEAPLSPGELQPPQGAGAQPAAPANDGLAAVAESAKNIVDSLARSAGGSPEQAAGVQQALEAIMSHLENQAATAAPKVDVAGIMGRLRDLEEQQQSLQSQYNSHRWGP
jgi:hypothetical protein